MTRGRPPELPLDAANVGPVHQTVALVDDRGRIQIPLKIVDLIDWLSRERPCDALAVLDEPGRVRLQPWRPTGEQVVQRRLELIERTKSEISALDSLRALEDRYKRIRIPRDSRLTLSVELVVHLGLSLDTPSLLYVWAIAQIVELNSLAHRNKNLTERWPDLADLP